MKLLVIATLLMSATAFAHGHEEKAKTLDEIKTRISANIDQRIAALQSHKACVQGAASKDALQACRDANKDAMKKLHVENKGERKEYKDKKKAEKKK